MMIINHVARIWQLKDFFPLPSDYLYVDKSPKKHKKTIFIFHHDSNENPKSPSRLLQTKKGTWIAKAENMCLWKLTSVKIWVSSFFIIHHSVSGHHRLPENLRPSPSFFHSVSIRVGFWDSFFHIFSYSGLRRLRKNLWEIIHENGSGLRNGSIDLCEKSSANG